MKRKGLFTLTFFSALEILTSCYSLNIRPLSRNEKEEKFLITEELKYGIRVNSDFGIIQYCDIDSIEGLSRGDRLTYVWPENIVDYNDALEAYLKKMD